MTNRFKGAGRPVSFSPDGRLLVCKGRDCHENADDELRVYAFPKPELVRILPIEKKIVTVRNLKINSRTVLAHAVSPDSTQLAYGCQDGSVQRWGLVEP